MSQITKASPKSWKVKLLEKFPGIVAWILVTSPVWAAFLFPNQYGVILLCFIVYLVMKSLRNLIYFVLGYLKIQDSKVRDWNAELNILKNSDELKHIVIVPYANESLEVLLPTMEGFATQNYDLKKLYICLTSEMKFPVGLEIANKLKEKYDGVFGGIWITQHTLKAGEIVGKAANMLNGALYCKSIVEENNWNEEFLTMTSCDCDSIFPPNYFSMLSYNFLLENDRYTIFWSGAMGYIANYWDLKFFTRIVNSQFTYYNIGKFERSQLRFVQISTYTASYKLFKDIGFYTPDVVPEDFHTFFKALFKFGKKVRCEGLPCIIGSDAAIGMGVIGTVKNQYKQVQRWAYGVSDFPYMVINMFKSFRNSDFDFGDKLYILFRVFNVLVDMELWPTAGFVLLIGFYLVLIFNPDLSNNSFWWRVPSIISSLWGVASLYFIVSYAVFLNIRPPLSTHRTFKSNFDKRVFVMMDTVIELFFVAITPLITLILVVLPALDAHTRLIFGKYLEYWVTEKN